jgi:hypothetical protein
MVTGGKNLFALLNQMNEKAQKIIDRTNAEYIFTLVFNTLTFRLSQFLEWRI